MASKSKSNSYVYDGIIKTLEGKFTVFIMTQGGTEFEGEFDSIFQASQKYLFAQKAWNNNELKIEDIEFFKEVKVEKIEIKRIR